MSQFSFSQYTAAMNAAQNKSTRAKVGYFKLADDGDTALARINAETLNDIYCASIHTINYNERWIKVSCLNELGNSAPSCELCKAAESGTTVSKATKKMYIPMVVSYLDKITGQWSSVSAVIWERPMGFAKELATLIRDYGNLRNVLVKITRNGKKKDMKTTYSVMPAPPIFKPEMIPADFSAFDGFKINKHSYFEKTPEEIHTYVTTGEFPESSTTEDGDTVVVNSAAQVQQQYTAPTQQPVYQQAAPQPQSFGGYTQPQQQAPTPTSPEKKFTGFDF